MNEKKFTGKAEIYDKFRPNYSREFIKYLYESEIITKESVIADIGSGTGIMGILFAKEGNTVYCVEPNLDMLRVAKRKLVNYKNCILKRANAEHTQLDDNSIDLIVVAQAFHWFNKKRFKEECQRIIKPNGNVALVWNSTDPSSNVNVEISNINSQFCPKFKGFSNRAEEDENEYAYFFKNGHCDFKLFENNLLLNERRFIGRLLSRSYSLNEDDPKYEDYIKEMKFIFKSHAVKGKILIPNTTRSYIGKI